MVPDFYCALLFFTLSITRVFKSCECFKELPEFPSDIDLAEISDFERVFTFGHDTQDKRLGFVRIIDQTWKEGLNGTHSTLLLTLQTEHGENLRLQLRLKTHLVSPSFKLVIRGPEGVEEQPYPEIPPCLFTGKVLSAPGGRASLSRCGIGNMLRGVIVTPNGHYILHPAPLQLRRKRESLWNETTQALHIILSGPSYGICGVHGTIMNIPPLINALYEDDKIINDAEEFVSTEESLNQSLSSTFDNYSYYENISFSSIKTKDSSSTMAPTISVIKNHKRTKRKSKTKTIEIAVFVDDFMYKNIQKEFRDEDTTKKIMHLVFTMINSVELLYNQPSLSIPVRIVLLRIDILKPGLKNKPDNKLGDIQPYLTTFCKWQSELNPGYDTGDPNHWDHALLLSGMNLFDTKPDQNSVIGLAWVSGMCTPKYSCTINEGNSFESVFVITHEMGHNLGMKHDGQNKCNSSIYIMSPSLGPGKVTWSSCSKNDMLDFLSNSATRQQASCLDDSAEPSPSLRHTPGGLPGERYPAAKQCAFAFGPSFTPYYINKEPFNNICQQLWCRNRTHAQRGHPALEGTSCGRTRICTNGKCSYDNRPVSKINNSTGTLIIREIHKGTTKATTPQVPAYPVRKSTVRGSFFVPASLTSTSAPNSANQMHEHYPSVPGVFKKIVTTFRENVQRLMIW